MRRYLIFLPAVLVLSVSVEASHLREADVEALEEKCQASREKLLADEKVEAYDTCKAAGELDELGCREKAAQEGEMRRIGTNYRVGEYYDIPECVEAYRARKHYQVNPSLRDR